MLDVHMARAKERKAAAGGDRKSIEYREQKSVVELVPPLMGNEDDEVGKSRDLVAASLGISGRTVSDAKVILEKGMDAEMACCNCIAHLRCGGIASQHLHIS